MANYYQNTKTYPQMIATDRGTNVTVETGEYVKGTFFIEDASRGILTDTGSSAPSDLTLVVYTQVASGSIEGLTSEDGLLTYDGSITATNFGNDVSSVQGDLDTDRYITGMSALSVGGDTSGGQAVNVIGGLGSMWIQIVDYSLITPGNTININTNNGSGGATAIEGDTWTLGGSNEATAITLAAALNDNPEDETSILAVADGEYILLTTLLPCYSVVVQGDDDEGLAFQGSTSSVVRINNTVIPTDFTAPVVVSIGITGSSNTFSGATGLGSGTLTTATLVNVGGEIELQPAGSPSASGVFTVGFNQALVSAPKAILATLVDGTGTWPITSAVKIGSVTSANYVVKWATNGASLAAGSTYKIHIFVLGS